MSNSILPSPAVFRSAIRASKTTLHDLRSLRLERQRNRGSPSPGNSGDEKIKAVSQLWMDMKGGKEGNQSVDLSGGQSRRLVEILKAESGSKRGYSGQSGRLLYRKQHHSPIHPSVLNNSQASILTKALRCVDMIAIPAKSRSPRAELSGLKRHRGSDI